MRNGGRLRSVTWEPEYSQGRKVGGKTQKVGGGEIIEAINME